MFVQLPRPGLVVLHGFAAEAGGSVLDLDDVAVRAAVVGNVTSIVSGHAPVCVEPL